MTGKNRIIIQIGGILHNSCSKFNNVLRIAGENQKKEVQPQVQESCCTPREEEHKQETMKEKEHDRGCDC